MTDIPATERRARDAPWRNLAAVRAVRLVTSGAVLALAAAAGVRSIFDGAGSTDGVLEMIVGSFWSLLPASFGVCGALIVWKQPRNAVGWILMLPALAGIEVLMPIARASAPPPSVGVAEIIQLWFDNVAWMFLIFPVFHLLQVFPDGSLLSRRWRPLVALEVLMVAALAGLGLFSAQIGPLDQSWTVENPIGLVPTIWFEGLFEVLWATGLVVLTLGGLVVITLRFRRGRGAERQQIKWLLLAVSVFAAAYILVAPRGGLAGNLAFDLVLVLSILGIPAAILISVTRYRLYDIDRIISRTLSYVVVIGLLGTIFGGLVLAVGTLFDDSLAVAGSTLAVAALFNPLRNRIQRGVDRRFNRSRFDTERVMEDFAASLHARVDPDDVVAGLTDVVAEAMQPVALNVWVR